MPRLVSVAVELRMTDVAFHLKGKLSKRQQRDLPSVLIFKSPQSHALVLQKSHISIYKNIFCRYICVSVSPYVISGY